MVLRPAVIATWMAALVLGSCAPAQADPRWWWSDLRLTDTPGASITPHLRAPGYATGGAGGQAVFITWAEEDPAEGDFEVWLTATFDAGCTFCPPTRLTDTSTDELRPRVAVLALPEGTWSIAVIFERPAPGEVVLAWDSTHLSYRVPTDQLCAGLATIGPAVITGGQYVPFGGVRGGEAWPDVSAAGTPEFGHFHATWREMTFTGPAIQHARDLTARGGIGWSLDPVKTVAAPGGLVTDVVRPRIAADLLTDPDPISGLVTRDRSGASIVFVRMREAGPAVLAEIAGLRSVDSGATFSPRGDRADAPAEALSDARNGADGADVRPAIDSAFSSFSTTDPAWVASAWSAQDPFIDPIALGCDQRHLTAPASPLPDWRVPGDDDLGTSFSYGDGSPSLALQHAFNAPAPQWTAWQDSRSAAREIVVRAGMLDATAVPALDLSRFPIAPVRPLDTGVSSDVQLSHCAVDDATLLCPTTRAIGEARDVSLDANEMGTYAAWSDTRDGNAEIYFKRVDQFVTASTPALSADCDPDGTAHVDVTFPKTASCPVPFAGERMLRYLIHWRSDPTGPYDNAAAPLVVMDAGEPGPAITRRIAGLSPGTTWHVIVVPEDEARNVSPQEFDPRVAPAFPPFNEASIVTPAPCAVAEPCLFRSDVTSLSPHVPDRAAVYLVPPSADDVHLQGPAYRCPFAPGELEPDAAALENGVALSLYQVNRPAEGLRLSKSGRTILFLW